MSYFRQTLRIMYEWNEKKNFGGSELTQLSSIYRIIYLNTAITPVLNLSS
jgi:hypothetical protein